MFLLLFGQTDAKQPLRATTLFIPCRPTLFISARFVLFSRDHYWIVDRRATLPLSFSWERATTINALRALEHFEGRFVSSSARLDILLPEQSECVRERSSGSERWPNELSGCKLRRLGGDCNRLCIHLAQLAALYVSMRLCSSCKSHYSFGGITLTLAEPLGRSASVQTESAGKRRGRRQRNVHTNKVSSSPSPSSAVGSCQFLGSGRAVRAA